MVQVDHCEGLLLRGSAETLSRAFPHQGRFPDGHLGLRRLTRSICVIRRCKRISRNIMERCLGTISLRNFFSAFVADVTTLPDTATALFQGNFSGTGYTARQMELDNSCETSAGIFGDGVADRHKRLTGRRADNNVNCPGGDAKKKWAGAGKNHLAPAKLNAALGEGALPDLVRHRFASLEKRQSNADRISGYYCAARHPAHPRASLTLNWR